MDIGQLWASGLGFGHIVVSQLELSFSALNITIVGYVAVASLGHGCS
jgi:hypothetical protein